MAVPPLDSESIDLEAMVKHELRGPVHELVRRLVPELVAEELNGKVTMAVTTTVMAPETAEETPEAAEATPDPGGKGEPSRRCSRCKAEKPPSEFTAGHYECKACRRTEERDRARRKKAAAEEATEPEG